VHGRNLHLTLAFIGELPLQKAQEASRALRGLSSEPFDWCLDHVGRFERARVLWAGGPPEPRLTQLADRVRERLKTLRIGFDDKRFAAHVTLLRDLPSIRARETDDPVHAIEPFVWTIREPVLMVSERDPQGATLYRPLFSS